MDLTAVNPAIAPEPSGGYANALEVSNASRLLFISWQVPQTRTGETPRDIEAQCRLVWANVTAAGMATTNLVKITTFLADRAHSRVNTAVRNEVLGDHRPALTVIVTGIWDPAWLIEIEAIAAA